MTVYDTFVRGAMFHPDPDRLVALTFGFHDYRTVSEAKEAYVNDELGILEFEAILEGAYL